VNTSEPLLGLLQARQRVLEIQTKLHRWANDDPHRRFDDLFNLVTDPSFLLMAWERVEGNKGARSAGVDGTYGRPVLMWAPTLAGQRWAQQLATAGSAAFVSSGVEILSTLREVQH
jgi:retron-type reverse transcriptase